MMQPMCGLQVVLKEADTRKVIFSTFDPDCATLLSLKQPRFPGSSSLRSGLLKTVVIPPSSDAIAAALPPENHTRPGTKCKRRRFNSDNCFSLPCSFLPHVRWRKDFPRSTDEFLGGSLCVRQDLQPTGRDPDLVQKIAAGGSQVVGVSNGIRGAGCRG